MLNELRTIMTFGSLRGSDRIIIFLGAVFSDSAIKGNEMASNTAKLKALVTGPIQQRQLIAAMEWFCGTRHPDQLKFFPIMLKQGYEADLLDEETILQWAADNDRNDFSADGSMINIDTLELLKTSAQPFVTWLQEAESDDSDEEEEDA